MCHIITHDQELTKKEKKQRYKKEYCVFQPSWNDIKWLLTSFNIDETGDRLFHLVIHINQVSVAFIWDRNFCEWFHLTTLLNFCSFSLQTALELLEVLVRATNGPLSGGMVTKGFPAVVHVTLNTDDNATMQVWFHMGSCIILHYLKIHIYTSTRRRCCTLELPYPSEFNFNYFG